MLSGKVMRRSYSFHAMFDIKLSVIYVLAKSATKKRQKMSLSHDLQRGQEECFRVDVN